MAKTKEEILEKIHYTDVDAHGRGLYVSKYILPAMEEYADQFRTREGELCRALELAELEIKALYSRLGFANSNVLRTVQEALRSVAFPYSSNDLLAKYKEARNLLCELMQLKELKDSKGKTDYYLEYQPIAWQKVKKFLDET